jgi:hypothetical protein
MGEGPSHAPKLNAPPCLLLLSLLHLQHPCAKPLAATPSTATCRCVPRSASVCVC